MVDDGQYVDVPDEEFGRLTQYKQINHQYRAAMSYHISSVCAKRYGYPDGPIGYGFDASPLPNAAFPWMVSAMTGGAHSPDILDERGEMIDVGLTGPNTLAAGVLHELCRRLMVYERREQLGRLNAGRRTDSRGVGA